MQGTLYSVVYITLFLVTFILLVSMIITFIKILNEVREDKKVVAHFIAPLLLVAPGVLTEKGKKARLKFYIHIIVIICFVSLLVYLQMEYGKPPYMK